MTSKPKNKFNLKKIIGFFFILIGKKNKKSFSSLINYITESFEAEGFITMEEKKMLKNIVNFGDKKINTIMVPRSDIIGIPENITLNEIKKIITEDEHTRIPIYKDNIDHIIGFVHSKDLAKFFCDTNNEFNLKKITRKILFLPCSTKLIDALHKMRSSRVHIGIVLDEFGAVDGLVTIENLVEEIVGQIDDEHDVPLESSFFQIRKIDEKTYHFGGRVELKKFEEIFKIKFDDSDAETIGGLALSLFKSIPKIGDKIEKSQLVFKIVDADKRIVKALEIKALYDF